jgi:hypothetical protein
VVHSDFIILSKIKIKIKAMRMNSPLTVQPNSDQMRLFFSFSFFEFPFSLKATWGCKGPQKSRVVIYVQRRRKTFTKMEYKQTLVDKGLRVLAKITKKMYETTLSEQEIILYPKFLRPPGRGLFTLTPPSRDVFDRDPFLRRVTMHRGGVHTLTITRARSRFQIFCADVNEYIMMLITIRKTGDHGVWTHRTGFLNVEMVDL